MSGWAATNTLREWLGRSVIPAPNEASPFLSEATDALELVEEALAKNAKALDAYYQFTPHMLSCGVLGGHCDCGRDELDALYKDAAAALRAVREGK